MKPALFALILVFLACKSFAEVLETGPGKPYSTPVAAAAAADPGDTILLTASVSQGPFYISNLKGRHDAWIVIMGYAGTTIRGGAEGFHFSDIAYVKIQDITFTGQTGNGMNIDDAGSIETPSHHVIIAGCEFRNMGAQGNNDFLKLSGLDSFEVASSTFINGADGGSGIDMVGCHYGRVHHCFFDSMGSNSVQMKGGTRYIKIENNRFFNGGQRTLNLGGSTGLTFFRPLDAPHEAADIHVYANEFVKGLAPIAYVGCERVDVANNTITMPEKWIIRILQETVDTTRFVPCRNNMFRNNIVYFSSLVTSHVNIGSNTQPGSFTFSHNLWYNQSNPSLSTPMLPVQESSGIRGQDPLFVAGGDFRLKSNSPAIGKGTLIAGLTNDMQDNPFKNPPSIGAFEYFPTGIAVERHDRLQLYPNPAFTDIRIVNLHQAGSCRIIHANGQLLMEKVLSPADNSIDLSHAPTGIYQMIFSGTDGSQSREILVISR